MSQERPRLLNLIIVSPGDVPEERKAVAAVVADLNRLLIPQFGLELRPLRWETDAYPGFHLEGPQGHIDEVLAIDKCDIMVGVFWKRFGTPTGDADSGTEHELGRAFAAWEKSKGKRPHIMIYFKNKKYVCKDDAEREQLAKVEAYRQRVARTSLSWPYKTRGEFERLVRDHLLTYVATHAGRLGGKSYRVIRAEKELLEWNERLVRDAEEVIYMTGSRSHNRGYLDTIERRLAEAPALAHYRVLFGPPHYQVLKDHLRRLLELGRPRDRARGQKTLNLGLFTDYALQSEDFILGNEREALVILPSLSGVGHFTSAIVFTGPDEVEGLRRFVSELYGRSAKLETPAAVEALEVLYEPAGEGGAGR